jgi:hypothetical protein
MEQRGTTALDPSQEIRDALLNSGMKRSVPRSCGKLVNYRSSLA